MRRTAVSGLLCATVALTAAACTAGTGNDPVAPDDEVLAKATNDALDLLARSPVRGYRAAPVASGHDRTDDEGREVSEQVAGRALFQIACSGHGRVTVTIPRQHVSRLVRCGDDAAGFRFRGDLTALVVGERESAGAYAWRILSAS